MSDRSENFVHAVDRFNEARIGLVSAQGLSSFATLTVGAMLVSTLWAFVALAPTRAFWVLVFTAVAVGLSRSAAAIEVDALDAFVEAHNGLDAAS